MTPLVDVVMVILIFLMLTGTFAAGEFFLQSNMPMAQKGAGTKDLPRNWQEPTPIEIRVASYNELQTGEESWVASITGHGTQIKNSREKLTELLVWKRDQLNKAGTPTENIQVFLSPTGKTKYKYLIEAYQAAISAELKKVGFGKSTTN